MIGIGSPRASVESNFALRELVGEENFYTGIAHGEQERLQLALKVLREGGIYTPALREIESYDAVLVLGEERLPQCEVAVTTSTGESDLILT